MWGAILKRIRLKLPSIQLERESSVPLHAQLAAELRRAIASGAIPNRLPSTRALARHAGVSRNTVLRAYEALSDAGIIRGRVGSGTSRIVPSAGVLTRADLFRDSHYPFDSRRLEDPDGNPLHIHRR